MQKEEVDAKKEGWGNKGRPKWRVALRPPAVTEGKAQAPKASNPGGVWQDTERTYDEANDSRAASSAASSTAKAKADAEAA